MSFFKKFWDWLTAATPSSEVPTAPVEAEKVSVAPTFDEVKPDTFEPEVKVDSAVVATYAEAPAPVAPVAVEAPKKAEKPVTKKTAAKIVPAKKQPVKKTPAKQPAGKKSPAKKPAKK
jgi:hypothetical protein